jgi:hypothetical protein
VVERAGKAGTPGIDGVLLGVVIGNIKLVVPVDFAIRRPNPKGLHCPIATNCTGCRPCSMSASRYLDAVV